MSTHLYRNARFFTADTRPWAEALVVVDERLASAGDEATGARVAGDRAMSPGPGGATVLPGFVDGHADVASTGGAAAQVDRWGANGREEIQRRIAAWAQAHPEAP